MLNIHFQLAGTLKIETLVTSRLSKIVFGQLHFIVYRYCLVYRQLLRDEIDFILFFVTIDFYSFVLFSFI